MKPVYREALVTTIDSVKTGAAVREYRESKGVRVAEVVASMEVSQAYYYALEGGWRMWSEDLFKKAVKAINAVARKTR